MSSLLGAVALPDGTNELKADGSGVSARDDGILIQPQPGYVIKTKRELVGPSLSPFPPQKLFINVCTHDAIAVPAIKKRLDGDGKEIEGMNVPVSVGPFRETRDKAGREALSCDCVVNPTVLEADASEKFGFGVHRDFLCQFVMQCIEQKSSSSGGGSCKIDRKYTLPRLSYQGWVDPLTGENVDKESENAEVAKQMVRDVSKRPSIQEVGESNETASDALCQHVKKSVSDAAMKPSTEKPADVPAPSKAIPIAISIGTRNGNTLPLFDFLKGFNAARGDDELRVEPYLSPGDSSDSGLFSSQLLRFPLLLHSDEASSVQLTCDLKSAKPGTIRLVLSAYAMEITAEGYKRTECIFPFIVESSMCDARYDANTSVLAINLSLLSYDGPDVGSHPWMLQRGLSSKNKEASSPQRQKADVKVEVNNNDSEEDDDVYPEDRFHAQDAFSNYMLKKQQEEMSTN
mmetsp:Transcript_33394/g.67382  ORF Transcript_33394/g.67382 Transcript_33394/m.67382 type:complete len:460 (-) Transcript_33394:1347-2726(-)